MSAIHVKTASELLHLQNTGDVSSREIVDAFYDRMDEVDAQVNGCVVQFRERAGRDADEADAARARGDELGALHGLPITIKENIDVAGADVTLGLRARVGRRAERDAVVVELARRAGAIVLGKSNIPQTLLSFETVNHLWGTTNNPWNVERVPGGSSGGEGALLASGQTPLSIGTDIGGSIRIPATFCGVVGLKPTLHRWSNRGSQGVIMGQEAVRSQIGPMARTTEDCALLFRALTASDHAERDPQVPPLPFGDPEKVDLSGMRVGYYEDDGFFTPTSAVRRAVREAVEAVKNAGAEVVEYEPSHASDIVYTYFSAVSADGAKTLDAALGNEEIIAPLKNLRRVAHLPAWVRRLLASRLANAGDARVGRLLRAIGEKPVADFWRLTAERTRFQYAEASAWRRAGISALVCPAHATAAVPHGASADFTLSACYAMRYNLLNLPAGVVPVTRVVEADLDHTGEGDRLEQKAAAVEKGSTGLPVGVQVVAQPYREDVNFAVMAAIEREQKKRGLFPHTPVTPVSVAE